MPNESDLLHMYVRGDVMKGVLTFRMFIRILSYPWEVLNFSDLIIFSISLGVVFLFSYLIKLAYVFYEDNVWNCYNLMRFYLFYCQ